RFYREHAEQRVQEARRVCRQGTELKQAENQRRYQRTYNIRETATGYTERHREHAVQHHRGRTVPAAEKTALAGDQRADTVSGADRAQRHGRHFPGVLGADGVARKQDCEKYPDYQRAGKHAGETRGKNLGGDVRQWREREISGVAGRGER
ncbi:nuclease, partial [Escherichia coli]|nr:nuclease [Escherichia coli]